MQIARLVKDNRPIAFHVLLIAIFLQPTILVSVVLVWKIHLETAQVFALIQDVIPVLMTEMYVRSARHPLIS